MLNETWSDQWDRVLRRLEDLRSVHEGALGGTTAAIDAVHTFFQNLHHLKDWVGNDPSSGVTKRDGDDLIKGNPNLQLSADLANGSKHLDLTRTRTGETGTDITRSDVRVRLGVEKSEHKFYIQSGGAEYDVLRVAEGAVDAWRVLLSGRGLI